MIEIVSASLSVPGKGHDSLLVQRLGEDAFLLAVADGVTLSRNPASASQTALRALRETPYDFAQDFRAFFESFAARGRPRGRGGRKSATTISVALVRESRVRDQHCLVVDFFAVGDSPIWRVCVGPSGGRVPYERYVIHGAPEPETPGPRALYYPFRRDHIVGNVALGSGVVYEGEVLLLGTDGLTYRQHVIRDFCATGSNAHAHRPLLSVLFDSSPWGESAAQRALESYSASLFPPTDDIAIIAARCRNDPDSEYAEDARLRGEAEGDVSPGILQAQAVPQKHSPDAEYAEEGVTSAEDARLRGEAEGDASPGILQAQTVPQKQSPDGAVGLEPTPDDGL